MRSMKSSQRQRLNNLRAQSLEALERMTKHLKQEDDEHGPELLGNKVSTSVDKGMVAEILKIWLMGMG